MNSDQSSPAPLTASEIMMEAIQESVAQTMRWRRLWVATFCVLLAFLALGSFTALEIHENNTKRDQQIEDLEQITLDIDRATGPEAQSQQRVIIQQLVDAIDCSQRAAFQEALDALVAEGILSQRIIVRPTDCSTP